MRVLKRFVFGLLGIFEMMAVVGMFLPREVAVERNIRIDAAATEIFPHINNLRATTEWSPWLHHDPEVELI